MIPANSPNTVKSNHSSALPMVEEMTTRRRICAIASDFMASDFMASDFMASDFMALGCIRIPPAFAGIRRTPTLWLGKDQTRIRNVWEGLRSGDNGIGEMPARLSLPV